MNHPHHPEPVRGSDPSGPPRAADGASREAAAGETTPPGGRASRDRALFDRIAASYARKDLYEPSRLARRARLERTIDLTGLGSGADMLEVGCGAGFAAQYLRGRFATYTGLDYSGELIAFATQHHGASDVAFHAADLYDWRPEATYDAIFAIGVLHHLPDIPAALSIMRSILEPGGWLVVNEPQPANFLFHGLRKLRAKVDAAYSSEQEELEASALIGCFERAGFEGVSARAQGLLSTPFAEVTLRPAALARPLSALACRVDAWLEDHGQPVLRRIAWNVVVAGRRAAAQSANQA